MKERLSKKDIVKRLSAKTGLSERFLNNFINALLEEMKNSLDLGEKIKIINFGTFEVKKSKDRIGKDFKTGEPIRVPGLRKVFFYPAPELKNLINEKEGSDRT